MINSEKVTNEGATGSRDKVSQSFRWFVPRKCLLSLYFYELSNFRIGFPILIVNASDKGSHLISF